MIERLAAVVVCSAFSIASWAQVASNTERHRDALYRLGAEDFDVAITLLQELINDAPAFTPAYVSLADAHVYAGDLLNGRRYFEGLIEANPENPFAHYGLGRIQSEEENFSAALDRLKRSIALQPGFTQGYTSIADTYERMNDLNGAVQYFEGLIDENDANADAYYGLGRSYRMQLEWDRALASLDEALRLAPEHTDALSQKIPVYGMTSRYREVLATTERLAPLARREGDLDMLAYALFAESSAHFYLGDYWKSLETINESMSIAEAIGDQSRIAASSNNLSNLYTLVGDYRKARELLLTALKLSRERKDLEGEQLALNNLGLNAVDRGELDAARAYLEEALAQSVQRGSQGGEAYALINLAVVYRELGEGKRAEEALRDAAPLSREINDPSLTSTVLSDLAKLERERGAYQQALDHAHEALVLATEIEDVEAIWRARAQLGLALEQQGRPEEAMTHFAETIALYDEARDNIGMVSMGVDFLHNNDQAFPSMIRLLGSAGRHEEAFRYAEKYRATSLLALLSEARGVVEGLLPESARARLEQISDELEEAHAALSGEGSGTGTDRERYFALERRITDLEIQREALLIELQREHPAFFRLASSEPQDIDVVRSRNLGPNQALVEYVVGDEELSIFVLTQDELVYESVAVSREELERMLAELSPVFEKVKRLDDPSRAQVFGPQVADFSVPPARALYDVLLEPVQSATPDGTELVIVPDDVLWYLPFEMLVVDDAETENPYDFASATFLLERHAISYAASASLLDPNLQVTRAASRGVLALGNPDFGRREEDGVAPELLTASLAYPGGVVRGGDLVSLPQAETEVAVVADALPGSQVYVGEGASETAFTREASDYRILHLATHFLSDDHQPLYSKIVLSQEDDGEEDGYLQTYEIFNMRLNADMVVLSACNTGLGRLSRGEGLIGVSRAFLYAGVPSLVVSLWSVDDAATAMLMKGFYEHLGSGMNKKQALRRAKLDFLKGAPDGKRDPFYWAPFILIGDWSALTGTGGGTRNVTLWLALGVIVVVSGVLLAHYRQRRASARSGGSQE